MRRGEVLRLRWDEVDLEHDYIEAIRRKQSRDQTETRRQIELHGELKQHLLRWRRQSAEQKARNGERLRQFAAERRKEKNNAGNERRGQAAHTEATTRRPPNQPDSESPRLDGALVRGQRQAKALQ